MFTIDDGDARTFDVGSCIIHSLGGICLTTMLAFRSCCSLIYSLRSTFLVVIIEKSIILAITLSFRERIRSIVRSGLLLLLC